MSEKKRKGWQGQKQERKKEGREGAKEAREEDSRFIRQVVKEWDSLWFALEARSGAVCTAEAQQTLRPRFWSPQLLPTSYPPELCYSTVPSHLPMKFQDL